LGENGGPKVKVEMIGKENWSHFAIWTYPSKGLPQTRVQELGKPIRSV
jgi:hypothetical protein